MKAILTLMQFFLLAGAIGFGGRSFIKIKSITGYDTVATMGTKLERSNNALGLAMFLSVMATVCHLLLDAMK